MSKTFAPLYRMLGYKSPGFIRRELIRDRVKVLMIEKYGEAALRAKYGNDFFAAHIERKPINLSPYQSISL